MLAGVGGGHRGKTSHGGEEIKGIMSFFMIKKKPSPGAKRDKMDVMLEIAALAAEYAIPLRVYADIEHMRRGLEDEELGRKVKDDLLNMQIYPFCGAQ